MSVEPVLHRPVFAVSRLASSHGIRVRLRPASPQGLSALVWLPGSLTGRGSAKYGDNRSRQVASESTVAHLRVGGRHASTQQSLRAAEGDYAGSGSPRRESTGTAANWFGAKRPSGATEAISRMRSEVILRRSVPSVFMR